MDKLDRIPPKCQKLYPLSPMQEGMLFHSLLEKSDAYFEQKVLYVQGVIDTDCFEEAYKWIVDRYEVLRTVFIYDGIEKPLQAVLSEQDIELTLKDLSALPREQQEKLIENMLLEDRNRGFDLSTDILMRFMLIRTSPRSYVIVWSNHHIIMDGWCQNIIMREFIQFYSSLRNGTPLQLGEVYPYSDYIDWLVCKDKGEALAYWKSYLMDYTVNPELPGRRTGQQPYIHREETLQIEGELTRRLEEIARQNQVTLNTMMQTLWGIVLAKYNHIEDVVFGAVVAGRPANLTGVEHMIGLFINTIPVRIRLKSDERLEDVLKRVQLEALQSQEHDYVSLSEVQNVSSLKQELVKQIMVFENYPVETQLRQMTEGGEIGFEVERIQNFEQTNYDLNLIVIPGESLWIRFSYNQAVYSDTTIEQVKQHLHELIRYVVQTPEALIEELEIITAEEKRQILDAFNATVSPYPREKTIHRLFEEQVERTPEAEAVVFESQRMTYGELNAKANQLANALRARGVGADRIVGIMAERSVEMIVGVLAILKAGGAYMPIDPAYPEERIAYLLADSGTDILLTFGCESVPGSYTGSVLDLADSCIYDANSSNLRSSSTSSHALYVIYTSGTTGTPKGVVMEHRSIVNLLESQKRQTTLGFARTLQFAAFSFDVCAQELFSVLLSGGTLFVPDEATRRDPYRLVKYVHTHKIGTVFLPTAYLKHVISDRALYRDLLESIDHLIVAGEQLIMDDHFIQAARHSNVLVHNHYGPTESHVVTTYTMGADNDYSLMPPIGSPISNTTLYIVDRCNRLQPTGVVGELCIAGDSLARGYLNRPELTAERFVDNPFVPGGRMYRTGDLCRWLPNGNIEYMGRIDAQVKIRGYRIEPGEIESVLLQLKQIREAAVVAVEDDNGDKALCAYIVCDGEPTISELQTHLGKLLPSYMIPAFFVQLERMPLTVNGKLDRDALPKPEEEALRGSAYIEPHTEMEAKLAAIWQEVLGIERVGVTDDFFALGGHSLKAMTIIARIHRELQVEISLKSLLEALTIRNVANSLASIKQSNYLVIEPAPYQETYRLSSAQRRLFILQQTKDMGTSYNMPMAFWIEAELDIDRFSKAVNQLIQRHESLRTSFEWRNGEPVQRIWPIAANPVEFVEGDESLAREMVTRVQKFDLGCAPLMRITVMKVDKQKYVLFLDMHHIISDGVSLTILSEDLLSLYHGIELPKLQIQYKDYAEWEQAWVKTEEFRKQQEYWRAVLGQGMPRLAMPLDMKRTKERSFQGRTLNLLVNEAETKGLWDWSRRHNVTMNSLLIALYAVLLHKYTEQETVVIGSTVAGRNQAEVERIIGAFINFLPLRIRVDASHTLESFVLETARELMEAYANCNYPFDEMINDAGKNDPARNPLYDTMLIFHSELIEETKAPTDELKFTPYPVTNDISQLDFKLDIVAGAQGELQLALQYNIELFQESSMAGLLDRFHEMLRLMVLAPATNIRDLVIFSADEQAELAAKRQANGKEDEEALTVVVSGTFTVEPLEPSIVYWMNQFGLPVNIRFAGYNQVFQQLLDPNSLMSRNEDVNLLLVRFEDWLRDGDWSEDQQLAHLDTTYEQLIIALQNKEKSSIYFASVLPLSELSVFSQAVKSRILELRTRWKSDLAAMGHVQLVDFEETAELFGIEEIHDGVRDRLGHVPYTEAYYAALGTVITRRLIAWRKSNFKVIVLDCDNTLWKGVCGEEGTNVRLDEPYIWLQRFMLEKQREGLLLVLASKNNEDDVWTVFREHPEMILKQEDLTAWKINWKSKSQNVRAMAEALNVGLDSFIFIDDSPVECREMMLECPEVLTLQLPVDSEDIPTFLKHVWAFDVVRVTEEDRRRSEMYKQEGQREQFKREKLSMESFLSGLELEMSMRALGEQELARAVQLTHRTNQFNMNAKRWMENDLRKLLAQPNYECRIVEVRDRFGTYGQVGLVIMEWEAKRVRMDTFLLSCRVLGRGIETAVLAGLKRWCKERGVSIVEATYRQTEKNMPFREFMERSCWEKIKEDDGQELYRLPFERLPDEVNYITYVDNAPLEQRMAAERTGHDGSVYTMDHIGAEASDMHLKAEANTNVGNWRSLTWEMELVNPDQLLHKPYYEPLTCTAFDHLLKILDCQAAMPAVQEDYEGPRNRFEDNLIHIWEEVLGVQRIGIHDQFFALGGHSLRAMTMIARVHQQMQIAIELSDLFQYPTVAQLSEYIQSQQEAVDYVSISQVERRDYYPVSSEQKRLYLLDQMGNQGTAYNMPGVFLLEGKVEPERLESTLRSLVQRHEILRTSFHWVDGAPVQKISEEVNWSLQRVDGRGMELDEAAKTFIRPFDLSVGSLMRAALVQLEENRYALLFDMHHIISDGVSMSILVREFGELYQGNKLPELTIQYKDYACWQQEQAQTIRRMEQEAYWTKQFEDVPILELPVDYARKPVQSYAGSRIAVLGDTVLLERLNALARETETTLFMVLLAAYKIMLSKYSGQEDLVVGTPIAGRTHAELQGMLGLFVNTLALRSRPEGTLTFRAYLEQVKEQALAGFANQEYPFEELVEKVVKYRDLSRHPLFDTMFVLHNQEQQKIDLGSESLQLIAYQTESRLAKFDMTWTLAESESGLHIVVEYCTDLYKRETIERMSKSYLEILRVVIDDRDIVIKEIMMEQVRKSSVVREIDFGFSFE
ncbi:non-ribosomal peptide synthetase [Paenibacillus xylaniclasticus]|uniref:non-ribosomal peptide synthetase n=1 Tax=Paenibacillus xylaniclasticus TaxID=588083 RepID=UPI002482617B|nr:non-ribosomal peptide synthetase [Paenibacillus xylaniclasticus]